MIRKFMFYVVLTVAIFSLGTLTGTQAASFQGLGDLSGGSFQSRAYGISSDGSYVVGYSSSTLGNEAFLWTDSSGMVGLGDLTGGNFGSQAFDISDDGSVIVGWSNSRSGHEAFRWTKSSGMVGLGYLPSSENFSEARGVSGDGSAVVGFSGDTSAYMGGFHWTESGGMTDLKDLTGGYFASRAYNISADGSVIVGESFKWPSGWDAFHWTESGGIIGVLEGMGAYGVTGDGTIIVGRFDFESPSGYEGFRWTASGGTVGLGNVPLPQGALYSYGGAYDVSEDGAVIVGESGYHLSDGTIRIASIWDEVHGTRSLKDVLVSHYGLDLTGWALEYAMGISDDGRTIIGVGTNPSGNEEGWRAVLDPVPEPSGLLALAAGLLGLAGFVRRRK